MGEGLDAVLGGRARSGRVGRARRRRRAPRAGPRSGRGEGPCATTRRWSRRCDAGAAARRRTAPNPWVGCVLVRDGEIVGAGATEPPGPARTPKPARSREAGDRARGATAYVTLEPCSHHGRTPPCADALIDAGVDARRRRARGPRPAGRGRGYRAAARRGHRGRRSASAPTRRRATLAPYLHHRRTGRPFVVAKAAIEPRRSRSRPPTARRSGSPADAARADAHELRADSQAIVVGAGTALADQPDAHRARRRARARRASRCGCCSTRAAASRPTGPLFDTELAPTLVVTTAAAAPRRGRRVARGRRQGRDRRAGRAGGGVDLDETLALLGRDGVLQVLVEGGGARARRVLAGGLRRTGSSSTSRRSCSGRAARRRSRFAGPDSHRRRDAGTTARRRRASSAPTCASTTSRLEVA